MKTIQFIFSAVLFPLLFNISHAFTPNNVVRIKQLTIPSSFKPQSSLLLSSTLGAEAQGGASSSDGNQDENDDQHKLRGKLRRITGFSLTAFRSSWRAATGISLTAVYASAVAASGLWIRKIMSTILSVTPAWARYFFQPFLVFYYAPLFILRGLAGPTRKQAISKHKRVVEGWKQAVERAEQKLEETSNGQHLPAHVNDKGEFELDDASEGGTDDSQLLADAVAESVEQSYNKSNNNRA